MPQADVILKGLEPYGAVALVALGFGAALLLFGLRYLNARRDVQIAKIAARKELSVAKLSQKRTAP